MDTLSPDLNSSHGSGRHGPRACRNCAVAKAKCVPSGSGSTKCERCSRLKKECVLPLPSRIRKRRPPRTKVAQLEQKLDSIVTLLTSTRTSMPDENELHGQADVSHAALSPNPSAQSSSPSDLPSMIKTLGPCCSSQAAGTSASVSSVPSQTHSLQNTVSPHLSGESEEESYLNIFRTRMAEHFPFVVIDGRTSAQELRRHKPFLFKAIIVTASYKDLGRQAALGKQLVEELSRRMLVEGEKSIDLLQGLLVYMGWYQYIFLGARQITNLLQLAVALVVDLGLNMKPITEGKSKTDRRVRLDTVSDAMRDVSGLKIGTGSGTLEERRAFLGAFYLTSMISSMFRRIDPLRYTPYVEECCQVLLEGEHYPTDGYLVQLVQLQIIANTIEQSLPVDDTEHCKPRAPIGMHIKAIEKDLHTLKKTWKQDVKGNYSILMHYHSTEMSLYEMAFYDLPSQAWYGSYQFERLNALYACLESTLALVDQVLSIPADMHFHISMIAWLHITRALIFTRRFCFFESSDWDLKYVRSRINFPAMLDQMIDKTDLVRAANMQAASGEDKDILSVCVPKLRLIRETYLQVLAAEEEKNGLPKQDQALGDMWAGPNDLAAGDAFLDMYESFWQEIPQDWVLG